MEKQAKQTQSKHIYENYKQEYKKINRSETDKIIGGVAGGLGEFFDIDPAIFRLLFILATVFGGSGVIVYIVLWLIIPSASSTKSFSEESIRDNADEMQEKAREFAAHITKQQKNKKHSWGWGWLFIIIGILVLFSNFGLLEIIRFDKLWPLAIIFIGIAILVR